MIKKLIALANAFTPLVWALVTLKR